MSVKISVIVPSYNSKDTIRNCLKSLVQQNTPYSYEIIVVDSSNDGTNHIIDRKFPKVKLIYSRKRLSCGEARNKGLEEAQGEYIFFTDSDCIPDLDWIEKLRLWLDKGFWAVGGSVRAPDYFRILGFSDFILEFFKVIFAPNVILNAEYLISANFGCRREIFKYEKFMPHNKGEDIELAYRLTQRKIPMVLDLNIGVVHNYRTGLKEIIYNQYSLGEASAWLRGRMNLGKGKIFAKHPWLCVFLPPLNLTIIALNLLFLNFQYFLKFVLLNPYCLWLNMVWTWGFFNMSIKIKTAKK